MRLVRFQAKDGFRLGVISDDGDSEKVVDLSAIDPTAPRDIGEAIRSGRLNDLEALAATADPASTLSYDELTFAIPVSDPGKILCLGLNYMEHVNEGSFSKQDFPTVFMRSITSLAPTKPSSAM